MLSIMGFMVAVLSSSIFWVGYFFVSVIVTLLFIRSYARLTYRWVTKNDEGYNFDIFESVMVLILLLLFWPVVVSWLLILFLGKTLGIMLGKTFRLLFVSVDKMIPNVEIKVNKK